MKRQKKDNITVKKKTERKRGSYKDRLFFKGRFKENKILMEDIEEYGDLLIAFANTQFEKQALHKKYVEPFYLEDFLREEMIPVGTFEGWRRKSPYLEDCVQFVFNTIIGIHQEKGAAIRKFSEKTIHMGLHHYLPRWKASEKYHDSRDIAKSSGGTEGPEEVNVNRKNYGREEKSFKHKPR